jgi:isoleucyl-tRNA synthetase
VDTPVFLQWLRGWLLPSMPRGTAIEHVFAQLKSHLRRVAVRTPDGVVEAIGTGLVRTTPTHIRATYAHCGYPLPDVPT